jgi:hypothetical protein
MDEKNLDPLSVVLDFGKDLSVWVQILGNCGMIKKFKEEIKTA